MGARTDAARAEVVAARAELLNEVDRLESAGRAAVDIPAKVRRAPAKTAGVAAGAVFLLAGGPGRLWHRAKRAVRGPEADLPARLLPKDVDRVLSHLGSDGDAVRRVLDKEFADYLEAHREERRKRDLGATASLLAGSVLGPLTQRAGRQLAERLFSPESPDFQEALSAIRSRRAPSGGSTGSAGTTTGSAGRTPADGTRPAR
ncbi:MAG TPA: hypothetical protein VFI28_11080 [Candidatus Limnocylindrales bacterium]|nr:hypothetical protein [Candidatus Limnocylindrales bacterium]